MEDALQRWWSYLRMPRCNSMQYMHVSVSPELGVRREEQARCGDGSRSERTPLRHTMYQRLIQIISKPTHARGAMALYGAAQARSSCYKAVHRAA